MELDINDYGVQGINFHSEGFVPKCCLECSKYEWEATQDGFGHTFRWCGKGMKFPVRKGTCKRQNFPKESEVEK